MTLRLYPILRGPEFPQSRNKDVPLECKNDITNMHSLSRTSASLAETRSTEFHATICIIRDTAVRGDEHSKSH